jgi:hypothetical protein
MQTVASRDRKNRMLTEDRSFDSRSDGRRDYYSGKDRLVEIANDLLDGKRYRCDRGIECRRDSGRCTDRQQAF